LIVGLVLGVSGALVRDRLDDRVRGREDIEVGSGAPVMAFVPRVRAAGTRPITVTDPGSEGAEAYGALRLRLLHAASERGIKTLAITSSLPGEGKTTTVANLGVALAMAGKRVVVVSADLRRPTLRQFFRSLDGVGLTDVLRGARSPLQALSVTETPNLWVLDTGPRSHPDSPLSLLSSDAMAKTVADLRGFADFVLLDTPPLLVSPDVVALAPYTDGALFVVDPGIAERPSVEQARYELESMATEVVGVVVNRYDPRSFRGYGYGYGYRGGYGDRQEPRHLPIDVRAADPHGTVRDRPA
jgi:polysaccharide biosynthesis transport protein